MIDLKFLRENPEVVKQNIKNKFQDHKLPLVDEVIELDAKARAVQQEADDLRASRNKLSKQIGQLMGQGKKDEAEAVKAQVNANAARLAELEEQEKELQEKVTRIMMTIPNIIDPSVPIGKDDSCNVEIEKFGDPVVPDFEIPYHTDIMERFNGIDLDAAGNAANGSQTGSAVNIDDIEYVEVKSGDSTNITVSYTDSGKTHYVVFKVTLGLNKKAKDYSTKSTSINNGMKLIVSQITNEALKYSYNTVTTNKTTIEKNLLSTLQDQFETEAICSVTLSEILVQ